MKIDDLEIISSSPERFLSISADGTITTSPIKGTSARSAKSQPDTLQHSEKDRAENLMIVDLMRNDLARCSKAGSIQVPALYDVTPHNAVYHLSSTIKAIKSNDISTLEAIKAAFPPGSMTGAPKIRAMKLCTQLETLARGIYSGSIGWLGGDGSAELSVVIRTLIRNGNQFEFQIGGGIVADSNPQSELQETIDKAQGLLKTLGLDDSIFE